MPLFAAGRSEILRASEKDDQYKSYFRSSVGQFFRDLTGTQTWIRRKEELELVADLIYFSVTTLSGYQTLGEEYCSLIQVDATRQHVPTKWHRSMMVASHIIVPYLCKKFLVYLEQTLQFHSFNKHVRLKNVTLVLLPIMKQLITILHQLHLATFYFSSVFYDVAKRITGIQYLLVQGVLRNETYNRTYKILGWITLLHLLVSVIQLVKQIKQDYSKLKDAIMNTKTSDSDDRENDLPSSSLASVSTKHKCTLCLDKLHDITATPCGHLFCWYCINEWCQNKAECPLCREDIEPHQLVYLHYFEPS